MGRIGKKIKMKGIRKIIRSYIEDKISYQFDANDYDRLSELGKLVSIQNFYVVNPEHQYIGDLINQIKQGKAVEREMPDIGVGGLRIRHRAYRNISFF